MKDLYITIHNGGDEAVAAVERIGDDWRAQLDQAATEIEALRLTDAEREAVRFCGELCRMGERADLAATLRGLLERHAPETYPKGNEKRTNPDTISCKK